MCYIEKSFRSNAKIEHRCVVPFAYVSLQALADEQSGEIPPIRDQCESASGDQGKSTQLKSVIHGRCYLREEFEFPGVTPLVDFIHVLCYFVMFVYL